MSEDVKFTVYGSQIQKWTDDIQMLVKQRDQYKEENEELKESFQYQLEKRLEYFKKYQELKEEREKLKTQKIAFQRSYKQVYEENEKYRIRAENAMELAERANCEVLRLERENEKLKDKLKD